MVEWEELIENRDVVEGEADARNRVSFGGADVLAEAGEDEAAPVEFFEAGVEKGDDDGEDDEVFGDTKLSDLKDSTEGAAARMMSPKGEA